MQKFKNKPFVLIGVNSDSRERLKELMDDKTVTWRSFWDGGDPQGPIAKAWNIQGWPTAYLLDRKGIIRFKGHHESIDDLIAKLVDEKP